MNSIAKALLLTLFTAAIPPASADWDQWRGPGRSGVSDDPTALVDALPEGDLPTAWTSDPIPSDHDGGHGSPIYAGGKVVLSVVWHHDIPTDTRQIDDRAMRALGHMNTGRLGAEKEALIEEARKNLDPRLRGTRLEEWTKGWLKENLTPEENIVLGGYISGRFKQGAKAIDFEIFKQLETSKGRVFESHDAFDTWLKGQGFTDDIYQRVLAAVPTTVKEADDVVIALDGTTGEVAWKTTLPGLPTGRSSSSTPCVADGKIYAVGSTKLHCVSLADGTHLWSSPLHDGEIKKKPKAVASSVLVDRGRVYIAANTLRCYSADGGELLWDAGKAAPAGQSSPSIWDTGSGRLLMVAGGQKLNALDPKTGEPLFSLDAGGQSTPVFSGRHLVFFSKNDGFASYFLGEGGRSLQKLWDHKWLERRYATTPIIHQGHVYLFGSNRHLCVELATGEEKWQEIRSTAIGSPILADGKLFGYDNKGAYLVMVKADPQAYTDLGRAKLRDNLYCATPAIGDGRLYIRHKNHVAAYDLAK